MHELWTETNLHSCNIRYLSYITYGYLRKNMTCLSNGIQPKWTVFFQFISYPPLKKMKFMAEREGSARKDVKRAFGAFQSKFHILAMPARFLSKKVMATFLQTWIILHNMTVEDWGCLMDEYLDNADSNVIKSRQGSSLIWRALGRMPDLIQTPNWILESLCRGKYFFCGTCMNTTNRDVCLLNIYRNRKGTFRHS